MVGEPVGVAVVEALPAGVHQSRWGFHPCSKETDRKLRFLNRVYSLAVQRAAAWRRWERKLPKNRNGKEPARCPLFKAWRRVLVTKKNGTQAYISVLDDHGIGYSATVARTPAPTPQQVKPLAHSEAAIDSLVAEAKAWLDG